jgi:coenzyme F420-reducing hydrogenase delta subunit
MAELNRSLADRGIKSMRVRYSYVPLPVYKKASGLFTMFTERIKKFGPLTKEERQKIREELKE